METPEGGFEDRGSLKAWLDGLPETDRAPFARIIAHRAAMRALPFTARAFASPQLDPHTPFDLTQAAFRANLISRVALKYPTREITAAASAAAAAYAAASAAAANTAYAAYAAYAAASAAAAAASAADAASAAADAAYAAADTAYAAADTAYAAASADAAYAVNPAAVMWEAVSADVRALIAGGIDAVHDRPLWPGSASSSWRSDEWRAMAQRLQALDDRADGAPGSGEWQVWLDWYEARAMGKAPWGIPEAMAVKLEMRIALGDGREDFWGSKQAPRRPEAINAEIAGWVEAARAEIVVDDRANETSFGEAIGSKKRTTVSQFIIDFLQRRRRPASIDQIRGAFSAANYPVIDKTMRGALSRLALDGEIVRIERGIYEAITEQSALDLVSTINQTQGAIQFDGGDDEPISVRHGASVEEWDTGLKAAKRHAETLRLIDALMRRCQERMQTTDSVRELLEDIQLFREALGATVHDFDPDFAIPRGDALRQTLSAYDEDDEDDEFSKLPPISNDILLALRKSIPAYNQFISLDDHLAKRDEALLGPDARKRMVGPKEGQPRIEAAVVSGAAKVEVKEVMEAEALPAPDLPDPESRASRRYSESNKNFARRAIEKAWEYATRITIKGAVGAAVAGVGGGWAAAKWVWEYRDWLLSIFAENPTMLKIVQDLLEMLAKLPLG